MVKQSAVFNKRVNSWNLEPTRTTDSIDAIPLPHSKAGGTIYTRTSMCWLEESRQSRVCKRLPTACTTVHTASFTSIYKGYVRLFEGQQIGLPVYPKYRCKKFGLCIKSFLPDFIDRAFHSHSREAWGSWQKKNRPTISICRIFSERSSRS